MCHPARGTDEMLLGEREEEKKEVMDNGNQWKADECQKSMSSMATLWEHGGLRSTFMVCCTSLCQFNESV